MKRNDSVHILNGYPTRGCLLALSLILLCGCQSTIYRAERMPSTLRVASRANPQEVDLSKLAGEVTSSDIVTAGDVIDVTIAAGLSKDDTYTLPLRIAEDGTGSLPNIGRLSLAGLELDGVEATIVAACIERGLYREPHVTVVMKQQRKNKVRVIGAVEDPGTYDLPRNSSDLLSAIVMAGGLADDAGENVEIRNPNGVGVGGNQLPIASNATGGVQTASHTSPTGGSVSMVSMKVNLISAAKEGSKGFPLDDGAVVMVEKRDPAPIQVLGLVFKPAAYDYPIGQDLRVLDAIAMAGGLRSSVADKIYVIRPLANSPNPAVIRLSFHKAKRSGKSNVLLAPGDVVSVEQSPATVVLEVIQIIRFGISSSFAIF